MTSTKYSIDSSALMDGWIRHYPPDHFPRFWERIDALADERRFLVSEEVFEEIDEHDDSLKEWLNDRRDGIIVHTDNFVAQDVRQILASHERLVMSGTRRNRADPFVIAVARLRGATVVTGEKGGTARSPKIPSVCDALGILHTGLIGLIQAEGWIFD